MGAIKNVFVYSDSALIIYRMQDEPLGSVYVGKKSDLVSELTRRQIDDEDTLKIAAVERSIFIDGTGFSRSNFGTRTIELDSRETRYLTGRQRVFDRYAKNERFSPIKASVEPQLIELECFGPEESRSIAVGGVAPNGEHWLAIVLSAEAALEMIAAAGINPREHRPRLEEAKKTGLLSHTQMASPACFFGEIAFVVNCAATIEKKLRFN